MSGKRDCMSKTSAQQDIGVREPEFLLTNRSFRAVRRLDYVKGALACKVGNAYV